MAWIQPNGKGFRAVYRKDGKELKGPTRPTRREVEQWLVSAGLSRGAALANLIEDWRDEDPVHHRCQVARKLLRVIEAHSWSAVEDLTPEGLYGYAKETKQSRRDVLGLITILRWAKRLRRVPVAADVLELPLPPIKSHAAKKKLLTDDDVMKIKTLAWTKNRRAGCIVDYLLSYGARPITACRLLRSDLSGTTLTIRDAKRSGTWSHPVGGEDAANWLSLTDGPPWNGSPGAPLFPHWRNDVPWRVIRGGAHQLNHWYRRCIAQPLGLPDGMVGNYDLKRRSISGMLKAGIDLPTVALFTGHRTLSQLLKYATTNEENALAALKIIEGSRVKLPKLRPKRPKKK